MAISLRRVVQVVLALIIPVLSSGLNLLGANQHVSIAVRGPFLIVVMILRWLAAIPGYSKRKKE